MESILSKGAVMGDGGCRFSVWVPHADAVFVMGTFNDWDKEANALKRGDNDVWWGDVAEAQVGDEYRYRIVSGDKDLVRIDPYARWVTSSVGNARICEAGCGIEKVEFEAAGLNELVIYELHIGTFGKKSGQLGPGTLAGATERLAHLKELGVNAVEVMPLAEFPGGYSWGYNPSLIFAIESDYGEPSDFRAFVDRAHELGMAVIVDVVYSHFGPGDLDLWQFDGWSENDKGGIYFYNDWRSETPWGDTRPDYGRGEVREYIRENALMWLVGYGADGLRWDATAFIRNVKGNDNDAGNDLADGWSLMQWVHEEIYKVKPGAISIAEDLRGNAFLTKSRKDGGAGFVAQWDGRFAGPVRKTLGDALDETRDMEAVRKAITHRYYLNAFDRVIYTESHDEIANGKSRVPEEVDPGKASSWAAKKKSALGAALVMTSPGIPMLFQGQEFLEDDWFHDHDPIDWTKRERFAGIFKLYQDLIGLRLNKGGATAGLVGQEVNVYHVNQQDNVIAYCRWRTEEPGRAVVVAANFSAEVRKGYAIGFPAAGRWLVLFNSDSNDYDGEFGGVGSVEVEAEPEGMDGLAGRGVVDIGGYSVLILSLAGE